MWLIGVGKGKAKGNTSIGDFDGRNRGDIEGSGYECGLGEWAN